MRILRFEGVAGLLRRLRYRPSVNPADIPPPPKLAAQIFIKDHGCPALRAMMTHFLAGHGIDASAKPIAGQLALHIGWPEDEAAIRQGDIVMLSPNEPRFSPSAPATARLSLIIDHDPARLKHWEGRPTGQPHRIALPSLPACDADAATWHDYAAQNDVALRRLLFFCGWIKADQIDFRPVLRAAPSPQQLCLSLPETPSRTDAYRAAASNQDVVVDALLQLPGWKGTAHSYQRLAQAAIDLDLSELLIFQDDCDFGPDLRARLPLIRQLMAETGADMFAGIVTDADDSVHVGKVISRDGLDFAVLNKSVGLTFNIFGRRALERLASWDATTHKNRTIDRFLSDTEDMKVLTCLPYLAHHRSELVSTLWYFSNARYDRMIHTSEQRLLRRMKAWRRRHQVT